MKALPLRRPSALRPSGLPRCLLQESSLGAIIPIHHSGASCVRPLSSTASRQDKSRRIAVPRRKTAATFDVPQFTLRDVPPEPVLEAMLAHPATPAYLSGMTSAQCHSLLLEYASRTLQLADPARDFRQVFQALLKRGRRAEEGPDQTRALHATLHCIAGMLVQGPPGPVYNLALHILHALVKLDYAPSVLSETRIALVSRKVDQPQFAPAVERFERLVKSMAAYRPSASKTAKKGKSGSEADTAVGNKADEEEASLRANTFTLKGLMIVASNQDRPKPSPEGYREALKYFEAAVGGSPTKSPASSLRFDWQIPCMVEMGHCYVALGATEKAHAAWKFAAEELDDKDATALYALHALQPDEPARERLLLKAAVNDSKLAVDEMNRVYHEKVANQMETGVEGTQGEGKKWDRLLKKVVRDEWEKLASPPPAANGSK
ncbi:hypothetical protein PG993_013003 [Apiospora rasikravindrae]|uniref:Uncharacterized protein n=1 Tax=Apiospora rasikravindrae TaxID=990691 RepID=A0ABR1RXY7_9PEZI